MKKAVLIVVILGGGMAAYGYYRAGTVAFVPDVSTVAITEGEIVDTVGATGALEAFTTVQVGSQVSGLIEELNVDFNSIVREGDVIMRLDPSLFQTQVAQARANLLRAEADVERLRVAVDDAATQLRRAEDLTAHDLIAETDLEAAQVALGSAEAQQKSAEAQVVQARATLNQHEVNLEHTVIRAPIDGIVISRLVDIGQTVAASFQAPELFVIAGDLTKMRVIANIDESDVGQIRPSQRVTFTVDAFPAEEFEGSVAQIRLEPVVLQNVVTYATVIDAPNPELKLKPGMTATVSIEIARREHVVRIPNAALRFRPTPDMFAVLNQPVPSEWPPGSRRPGPVDADGLVAMEGASTGAPPREGTAGDPPPAGRDGGFEPPAGAGAPDGPNPDRRRRMMERVQSMSPEEREQFFASRREARGAGPSRRAAPPDRPTIPTFERGANTIDALFAPIEVAETAGQVWVLEGGRLSSVGVRLGVTDGRESELIAVRGRAPAAPSAPALASGLELVTNVSTPEGGVGLSGGGSGSPLMPQFPFGRRRGATRGAGRP